MILKITGKIGSGKSTLANYVINLSQREIIGFRSYFDDSKNSLYLEFVNGPRYKIAFRNGKMVGIKETLDDLAMCLNTVDTTGKVLFIDEIGYVEIVSQKFVDALLNLIKRTQDGVIVIRENSPLRGELDGIGIFFEIHKVEAT
ncbi:MAG: nucleoside-triphosphatase [Athalassotoga sp.]|uniref:nucleoside-triphosphatase n=1 Tax=Athalassotoga sp. TaxID=2022597 RepID=UPI003D067F6A